ncbi:MAG: hypothetical protein JSW55_06925, partial [Chloroflexota bacterium]
MWKLRPGLGSVAIWVLWATLMVMNLGGQKRPAIAAVMLLVIILPSVVVIHAGERTVSAGPVEVIPRLYLPLVSRATSCPTTSGNSYAAGAAFQYDLDNPIRPAWNHADKNLALRGYTTNADGNLQRQLVNYGSDDPTQPPQFATLFRPARVPELTGFYRVGEWIWAPSPDPGRRGLPISQPKVTALGLQV